MTAADVMRSALLAVVVVMTACASSTTAAPASDPATVATPSTGMPADAWAAVLDTAVDPGRLGDGRREALAALGDVLEGSVVVSPVGCLDGLPPSIGDGYVLAIVRSSRDDVEALASQLPREPSFVGAVTVVCSD